MSSIASEADIEKLVVDVCAANGWNFWGGTPMGVVIFDEKV